MDRELIIRLAEEAGLEPRLWNHTDAFERFAALVAAHEREECAKVCDDRVVAYRYATDHWAQEHIDEARHLAAAIRSRT